MVGIESHDNGDIAALQTKRRDALAGDLFVDCTGLQSLLLGQHYGVPFVSQKHVLFNDTALALQMPYAADSSPIASQTISTAQSSGWIWDIGLPTRRGVGHVYSSAHTSDERRRPSCATTWSAGPAGQQAGAPPRKISFNPGYRQQFWHRNCVAIGLSAGFIEPLEASALALVELSAAMLSDEMPATREAMDIVGAALQRLVHVSLGTRHRLPEAALRADAAHGLGLLARQHRRAESIPDRLSEQLTLWRHQPPSRYDLLRIEEVFPSASYQYVLYGMGFRPEPDVLPAVRMTATAPTDFSAKPRR